MPVSSFRTRKLSPFGSKMSPCFVDRNVHSGSLGEYREYIRTSLPDSSIVNRFTDPIRSASIGSLVNSHLRFSARLGLVDKQITADTIRLLDFIILFRGRSGL